MTSQIVYFQTEAAANGWLKMLQAQGMKGYVMSVTFGVFEVRSW